MKYRTKVLDSGFLITFCLLKSINVYLEPDLGHKIHREAKLGLDSARHVGMYICLIRVCEAGPVQFRFGLNWGQ